MNYRQEIIVASAGPAVSLLTAYLFHKVNATYFIISALLAATNLLPIYPLDGGRMLKSALMMCISPTLVQLIMKVVSFLVCSALMLAACWYAAVCQTGIWPIFAVLIVLIRFWESSCTEFGIQNVSRNDIIRYKLYLELESNGFKTLYSNTYIFIKHISNSL